MRLGASSVSRGGESCWECRGAVGVLRWNRGLQGSGGGWFEKQQGQNIRREQGTRSRGRGSHGNTIFQTGLMIEYLQNNDNTLVILSLRMLQQWRGTCAEPGLQWSQHRNIQSNNLMLSVKCTAFNQQSSFTLHMPWHESHMCHQQMLNLMTFSVFFSFCSLSRLLWQLGHCLML